MRVALLNSFSLLLLIISNQNITAQTVDKMSKEISRIENQMKIKTDSLNKVKMELSISEFHVIQLRTIEIDSLFPIQATIKYSGKVRKTASPLSGVITVLKKNDSVLLTCYQDEYWCVNNGKHKGYISEIYLNNSDELKMIKREWERSKDNNLLLKEQKKERLEWLEGEQGWIEAEIQELRQEKESIVNQLKQKEYNQKIVSQYGEEIGRKLLSGIYWLGMTDKMAKISFGNPIKINKSVGSWGVHEQWVYEGKYLYFENGVLTSWQD